jgi:5-enolpyruvylshikimate-3-phosphate synthase
VRFDSGGDHRLAMAAVAGALGCPGGGIVDGFECVGTSYPAFLDDLETLAGSGAWETITAGR